MSLRNTLREDRYANQGNPKGRTILFWFRIASTLRSRRGPLSRMAYLIVGSAYKFIAEWALGVELPASTSVGAGLALHHGVGLVVNPASRIGANVTLRQSVTIGNRGRDDGAPTIEDDVSIGAGAVIIGNVRIGRGAKIGALALITSDVPPGATALAAKATIRLPKELA